MWATLWILLQTIRNTSPWSLEIPSANIVNGALSAALPSTVPALETTPSIATGVEEPATTPTKVGDIFVDTDTPTVYIATGTTASTDWTALN